MFKILGEGGFSTLNRHRHIGRRGIICLLQSSWSGHGGDSASVFGRLSGLNVTRGSRNSSGLIEKSNSKRLPKSNVKVVGGVCSDFRTPIKNLW